MILLLQWFKTTLSTVLICLLFSTQEALLRIAHSFCLLPVFDFEFKLRKWFTLNPNLQSWYQTSDVAKLTLSIDTLYWMQSGSSAQNSFFSRGLVSLCPILRTPAPCPFDSTPPTKGTSIFSPRERTKDWTSHGSLRRYGLSSRSVQRRPVAWGVGSWNTTPWFDRPLHSESGFCEVVLPWWVSTHGFDLKNDSPSKHSKAGLI